MNLRNLIGISASLLFAGSGFAQITFDGGNSTWGAGSTSFVLDGGSGSYVSSSVAGGTAAYAGGASDGTYYSFGFANSTPSTTAHYNLTSTDLTAGTALNLTFTGVTSAPNFVALTGGALTSYEYNATSDTLTIGTSTVNPVASASDTTGGTLSSAFGLIIDYGGSNDYSGTVFRSDMFWGDLDGAASGYSGDTPLASINADGFDGVEASFVAHLPVSFLQANGIDSPNDCIALVQKSGGSYNITIVRELYASSDIFDGTGYTYGGASSFDFDGSGDDNFVLATYSNSTWSAGNIGITAVPEPSSYATLAGMIFLGFALARRRR